MKRPPLLGSGVGRLKVLTEQLAKKPMMRSPRPMPQMGRMGMAYGRKK